MQWGGDRDNGDGGNGRKKKRGNKKGRHRNDDRSKRRFYPVLRNVGNVDTTCCRGKDKRARGDGPVCVPAVERAPSGCIRQYALARGAPSCVRASSPMERDWSTVPATDPSKLGGEIQLPDDPRWQTATIRMTNCCHWTHPHP